MWNFKAAVRCKLSAKCQYKQEKSLAEGKEAGALKISKSISKAL